MTDARPETPPFEALGYTSFEEDARLELGVDGSPARVTRAERGHVRLLGIDPAGGDAGDRGCAELTTATVPHPLRGGADGPIVAGDWVLVGGASDDLFVTARLPRRTQLARGAAGTATRIQVIAANVDIVFVVMGLDGDFQPRRVERYLALVADAGLDAVVLLTKAAACPNVHERVAACRAVAESDFVKGVHAVDVVEGVSADVPRDYLTPGRTVTLVGSSGAGKSTLVNHLAGREFMATQSVRGGDDRGRHTTTHRELIALPDGALLIDNPGMRELSMWLEGDGLRRVFEEIGDIAARCRFADCSHTHEPGCAVAGAVARGELDGARVERWAQLEAEAESVRRRRDEKLRRADARALGKMYRSVQKHSRRRKGD